MRNRILVLLLTTITLSFTAKAQVNTFGAILEQYYNDIFMSMSEETPYGEQFGNYDFEAWESPVSGCYEPKHWNSFKTATGKSGLLGFTADQTAKSTETRPGTNGSYSARIFAKEIKVLFISKLANGNMTTGRIYVGSSDVNSSSNYNYTESANEAFRTPISTVPDSLTVWVCFRAADANSKASVMTAIHGNTDLKQLASGGYDPSDMVCATASREYTRTCASGSSLVWKRLTIPFTPASYSNPKYILTSFSTNVKPGEGDDGDEVYIDDICLIYNPSLSLDVLAQTEYILPQDGSSISVEIPFNLTGSMSTYNLNKDANEVIAQLSDANGSFENPIELGRITTNESGVVNGKIPADIEEGDGYRIRVVSTNYPMTSEDNGTDISIKATASVDAYFAANIDIYPNPADDYLKINSNNIIREINIFSVDGRMIYSNNLNQYAITIDLNLFEKGTYIVRMILDEEVVVRRIVVN